MTGAHATHPFSMASRIPATPDTAPEAARTAPVAEDAEALLARLEAAVAAGRLALSRTDGSSLHAIAVEAARGHGAFEVAIGEGGLDLIYRRGGLARLGFSGIGDLARERLGLHETQGRRLRRNAEKLRDRPFLRAAVLRGEVTSRKAEVLLDRTEPVEDAYWTARARSDPLRRLEAALRDEGSEREEECTASTSRSRPTRRSSSGPPSTTPASSRVRTRPPCAGSRSC